MKRIRVLHGPNLNLLGSRQPEIYGHRTLEQVDRELEALGQELGAQVICSQSNHEGQLVDWIQQAGDCDALIINPAAFTHTSVAIRDALIALNRPVFEVHLSNVYQREPFRHHSTIEDIVVGRIIGFGVTGYTLALRGVLEYLVGKKP